MRKIRIEIESLEVESFATVSGDAAEGGTVHGRQLSFDTYCETMCAGGTSCESGGQRCVCGCDPTAAYC